MRSNRPAPNDSSVVIRRLWPTERLRWRDHLLRLTPGDRHMRFAGGVSDGYIERFCDDADFFRTRLVGAFVEGELRGVAECYLLDAEWARAAELAFSVEAEWQGHGLGTELFHRMVMYARNRSVTRAYIVSEPGNARMRHIAAKFGMELTSDPDEIQGRLRILWPTYLTVLEEAVHEGAALARETPPLFGNRP